MPLQAARAGAEDAPCDGGSWRAQVPSALRLLARAHGACGEPRRAAVALSAALEVVGGEGDELGDAERALAFSLYAEHALACCAAADAERRHAEALRMLSASAASASAAVDLAPSQPRQQRARLALVEARRRQVRLHEGARDKHLAKAERSALGGAEQEAALDAVDAVALELDAARRDLAGALQGAARGGDEAKDGALLGRLQAERGEALRQLGEEEEAIRALSYASQLLPPRADGTLSAEAARCRLELGRALLAAGRLAEAEQAHKEAFTGATGGARSVAAADALAEVGAVRLAADDLRGARKAWTAAHGAYCVARGSGVVKKAERLELMLTQLGELERRRSAVVR